ncbi:MAG: SRPBCC domain-containing protein [Prevotella sp.]|nr:SRPBCC domain-containing protein [Prevotella sp.]
MAKKRINIDHPLKSSSESIIWSLISTPEGMAKWLADEVDREGDTFVFTWGHTYGHHEIKRAEITDVVRNRYIRLRWHNDEDPEAYLELRVDRSDLTGDYMLHIVDFAAEDDVESLYDLWDDNLDQLHRSTGL